MNFSQYLYKIAKRNSLSKCIFKNFSKNYEPLVSVKKCDKFGTATVTLQRPPVNSLNLEFLQAITKTIKDLENDKVKGFVLQSPYKNTFSAGLDINEIYNPDKERFAALWSSFQEMWKTLYLTPMFTIASINGHAPAAGCLLALSCDYRIMVNSEATIGVHGIRLGIVVPKWFQKLLITNIGFRQAEKSLCLGLLYKASEAHSIKLVDEIADNHEDLKARVQKNIETWSKIPDKARADTKRDFRMPFVTELESYENKEMEEFYQFLKKEKTVKMLEKYIGNLKAKES